MKKYIWANGNSYIQTQKLGKVFASDLTEELVEHIKDAMPHIYQLIEVIDEAKPQVKAVVQDVKK